MERKRRSHGNLQTRESKRGDTLGHGKKVTEQTDLLSEDIGGRNSSGHKEKATKQRALTDWGPQREEINQVIERERPC